MYENVQDQNSSLIKNKKDFYDSSNRLSAISEKSLDQTLKVTTDIKEDLKIE